MQHAACYKKGYPRPRFVRESYACLNGEWNFIFDDENIGEKHKYYNDFSGFGKSVKINVPFAYQSEASGVEDKTDHSFEPSSVPARSTHFLITFLNRHNS